MHQELSSSQQPTDDLSQPDDTAPARAMPVPELHAGYPGAHAPHPPFVTREFASPGLTPGRRYGTAIMLFVLGLFVVGVVFYEGGSLIVSAVLGFLLIAGFIWYLRLIAPAPFILRLTADGLTRQEKASEPLVIPWDKIVRVKEEQFANGKIIGVMVYARSKHSVYRALVLYRDDLPQFDEFRKALKASTLPETPWRLETVHE
ncbi:MAG TPA: hypothetical protein VH599_13025 [Ktedonobacterales bacterium]